LGIKRQFNAEFHKLLASPNICSKHWVYEQYDSMVQTNTVLGPGALAGVIRIKGTADAHSWRSGGTTGQPAAGSSESNGTGHDRGLAMALYGNGRWCYLDPRLGAAHNVARAARMVACTGAKPVAATNCLNFGNPEKPPIMGQFSQVIDGMAEACTELGTPITGGNVSFYNETLGEAVYPTPVLGVVGILDDVSRVVGSHALSAGRTIVLLTPGQKVHDREEQAEFGSSEYASHVLDELWGVPPLLDLKDEKALQSLLQELAAQRLIESARDVAEGGIAVAAAKMCFPHNLGIELNLISAGLAAECVLFAEDASRVLVSCTPEKVEAIGQTALKYGLNAQPIGSTTAQRFTIRIDGEIVIEEAASVLKQSWRQALEQALHTEADIVRA
jgi:phosphoribosylformylglycinamidine synthase subunit PurL